MTLLPDSVRHLGACFGGHQPDVRLPSETRALDPAPRHPEEPRTSSNAVDRLPGDLRRHSTTLPPSRLTDNGAFQSP